MLVIPQLAMRFIQDIPQVPRLEAILVPDPALACDAGKCT